MIGALKRLASSWRRQDAVPVLPSPEPEAPAPAPERYFLSICAIMKNEAVNIVEWIAYHHALGVEKFYLYDNNSGDDTIGRIDHLVGAGIVDLTIWPINPGQSEAYDDYATRNGHLSEWTAFIDLDEFIHPILVDNVPDWLRAFDTCSAVAIQWLNFGPSGHDVPPPAPMIDAYRHRFPDIYGVHGHVKTIVRMRDYVRAMGPHTFEVTGEVVDERRNPVVRNGSDYAIQPVLIHDEVCLYHYYTRSRQEWTDKVARGMADHAADSPTRFRNPAWIEIYERDATQYDDRMGRFVAATQHMLDRFAKLR